MLKVAITGNISSGKTLVQNYLTDSGFITFCLDKSVDKLYKNSDELRQKLILEFNTDNKKEIAKFIFDSPLALKKLESIILPFVKAEMEKFFSDNNHKDMVFVFAPTLFESGFNVYFDKIIFISSDENLRLKRLIERNNYTLEYAEKRINSQLKEEVKLKKSDYIIYNNSDIKSLYNETDNVIKELMLLL